MANPPIGKLDHIGIAVKSVAEARKFFEGILGATFISRPPTKRPASSWPRSI